MFFAGSLLIEVIFSLDGLGRMSYDAAVSRDYPIVFGTLFIFTLAGLLIRLIGDLAYTCWTHASTSTRGRTDAVACGAPAPATLSPQPPGLGLAGYSPPCCR